MARNVESAVEAASHYDPEKNAECDDYCFSETTPTYIRHEFVRKVFGIVTIQLAATFGFLLTALFVERMNDFFKERYYIGIVAIVVFIFASLVISCKRSLARNKTVGIGVLFMMTGCMMLYVTCFAVHYAIFQVTVAAGLTAGLTLVVTIFAMQTKYDFTGYMLHIFCFAIVLFATGILIAFFPNRILHLIYSAIGATLVCVYLVVDIQLAVGGKKYEWTIDDYVIAAISIYVDVVSLFIHLLGIVASSTN
ncbi:hypothetical protein, conserved [Babesia bigemina]|uniref:Uncharacterized protein n=1 Tax=Babesia bigemina TaxID=5866 RepID=A0A061DC98_BABBI|nr:hypothetical protein, conserved [Babesia bigemina]CDR95420.1 hypothetical protein, conserved [Babesia bigemina]|eukprot:XP_012767606.1 hypothetical protein, conserved [Babesia bigemina]